MRLVAALALALCAALVPRDASTQAGNRPAPVPVVLAHVALADDPRHAAVEIYANLVLRPAVRSLDGARTAMREARVMGRALGIEFRLESGTVKDAAEAAALVRRLADEQDTRFVIVDLPGPMLAELATQTVEAGVVLLNVSAPEDELRGEFCTSHLFHVVPSRAMLSDALAQYAAFMGWRDLLLLEGPTPGDAALGLALAEAVVRFGGEIAARRGFVASNDPRQRELNNIRLLTQGIDYDAVLVADTSSDFGRYVPFQTVLPRPVVGSAGLQARAWHWTYERHGAPQLNQRFAREVDDARPMADAEWAAWAAARAVIQGHLKSRSTDFEKVVAALKHPDLTLDVYKGAPASFRPWDNQLRQPILLATADAVIARAPLQGFLHATNHLDTLGTDAPSSACRLGN